jgi:hypothetical protein
MLFLVILHAIEPGFREPPEAEPWLLGSVSHHDIQKYFDNIYHDTESLKWVLCRKGERSWNSTIQPYTWDVAKVYPVSLSSCDALLTSEV